MFPRFGDLPAELRARVWEDALFEENDFLGDSARTIELHSFDRASQLSFAVSRRYPSLLSVNREARYEAAKLDGGEWMPIYLGRYDDDDDTGEYRTHKAFEIYVNFARDTIFLSERFMTIDADWVWAEFHTSVEQYRIAWFASLLDDASLQKIQNIQLSAARPHDKRSLEIESWWKGEGLEVFTPGVLKTVFLVADSNSFVLWAMMAMQDTLEQIQEKSGFIGALPKTKAYIVSNEHLPMVYERSQSRQICQSLGFSATGLDRVQGGPTEQSSSRRRSM